MIAASQSEGTRRLLFLPLAATTYRRVSIDEKFGLEALPEVPALPQAHSDDQLIAIWLDGRSVHTQRAYRADIVRFRRGARKPLPSVTLTDLQSFADSLGELAAAGRYRILSALKLGFAMPERLCPTPLDHVQNISLNSFERHHQ